MSSGVASYSKWSPTTCGSPALDWATSSSPSGRAAAISAAICAISSGPRPQLAPTASTPASASAVTAAAGLTPIIECRLVSKLSVAITGRSGTTACAAATAACASARSLIVSMRTTSIPPSRSPTQLLLEDRLGTVGVEGAERHQQLAGGAEAAGDEGAVLGGHLAARAGRRHG